MTKFLYQILLSSLCFFATCCASMPGQVEQQGKQIPKEILEFYQKKFAEKHMTIKNLVKAALLKLIEQGEIEKILISYEFDQEQENFLSSYTFTYIKKFYISYMQRYSQANLYNKNYSVDMILSVIANVFEQELTAEQILHPETIKSNIIFCSNKLMWVIHYFLVIKTALQEFEPYRIQPQINLQSIDNQHFSWPKNISQMFHDATTVVDKCKQKHLLFQIAIEYAKNKFKTPVQTWNRAEDEYSAIVKFYSLGCLALKKKKYEDIKVQNKFLCVLYHLATQGALSKYKFTLVETKEFLGVAVALQIFFDEVYKKESEEQIYKKLCASVVLVDKELEKQLEEEFNQAQNFKEQIVDYCLASSKKTFRAKCSDPLWNCACSWYQKIYNQEEKEFLAMPPCNQAINLLKQVSDEKLKIMQKSDVLIQEIHANEQKEKNVVASNAVKNKFFDEVKKVRNLIKKQQEEEFDDIENPALTDWQKIIQRQDICEFEKQNRKMILTNRCAELTALHKTLQKKRELDQVRLANQRHMLGNMKAEIDKKTRKDLLVEESQFRRQIMIEEILALIKCDKGFKKLSLKKSEFDEKVSRQTVEQEFKQSLDSDMVAAFNQTVGQGSHNGVVVRSATISGGSIVQVKRHDPYGRGP